MAGVRRPWRGAADARLALLVLSMMRSGPAVQTMGIAVRLCSSMRRWMAVRPPARHLGRRSVLDREHHDAPGDPARPLRGATLNGRLTRKGREAERPAERCDASTEQRARRRHASIDGFALPKVALAKRRVRDLAACMDDVGGASAFFEIPKSREVGRGGRMPPGADWWTGCPPTAKGPAAWSEVPS